MKFFGWKCAANLSDTKYEILRALLAEEDHSIVSLKESRLYLQNMLGIRVRNYDCCPSGCMAYIGKYRMNRKCPHCKILRFIEPDGIFDQDLMSYPNFQSYMNLKPRAVFTYMPIIPRLKLLYANKIYSAKMRYPSTLFAQEMTMRDNEESMTDDDKWMGIRDVWEGDVMKRLRAEGIKKFYYYRMELICIGYFDDERTVALHFSTDGVRLFRSSKKEVWPFLLLNLNLPPEERY